MFDIVFVQQKVLAGVAQVLTEKKRPMISGKEPQVGHFCDSWLKSNQIVFL